MARSDEAEAFYHAVYSAIQEIPYGKVTTYGHIAKLIGTPQRPRQVGQCLKHLPDQTLQPTATFHNGNVPWQRVINSKGQISIRSPPTQPLNQSNALQAEGVTVTTGSMGELSVDIGTYGWFPRQLPSDILAGIEPEDSDDEEEEEDEE